MVKKKTGGRNFEKGNKAAKGPGRPWLDPDVKRMKRFTAIELGQLISTLLYATDAEVQLIISDPSVPTVKKVIAKALANAREHGNWGTLNSILDRLIGKIPDKLHLEGLVPSVLERIDGARVEFAMKKKDEEE
jgi:hypothetical protein